jgi:hypothetical protein
MVRAISRIIGSKIEQRILSAFDYNAPAFIRKDSPQGQRKPHRKFSGANKGRKKKASPMNNRM